MTQNSPQVATVITPANFPQREDGRILQQSELSRILDRVPPLLRAPRPKCRCPWTGKSRSSFLELVTPCARNNFDPPVKAIYQRAHKYATRGVWLVPSENLFRYLLSLQAGSKDAYLVSSAVRKEAAHANE